VQRTTERKPYVEELVASGTCHIWYCSFARGDKLHNVLCSQSSDCGATDGVPRHGARHSADAKVGACGAAAFAEAIAAYFPDIDKARLAACLARYKTRGISGQDAGRPRLVISGWSVASCPADLPSGVPFAIAVDNSPAEEDFRTEHPPLVP
jgi:hypothetical protein